VDAGERAFSETGAVVGDRARLALKMGGWMEMERGVVRFVYCGTTLPPGSSGLPKAR
jgi:hypothetical protein